MAWTHLLAFLAFLAPLGLTLFGAVAVGFGIAGWLKVLRDDDLTGGAKALWFFAILIFPLVGALVYLSLRKSP
jgi:Phospholipase_D-nuclease N-terminal